MWARSKKVHPPSYQTLRSRSSAAARARPPSSASRPRNVCTQPHSHGVPTFLYSFESPGTGESRGYPFVQRSYNYQGLLRATRFAACLRGEGGL